jgi:hypothetical protein
MAEGERQTAVGDLRLSVFLRPLHPEFFTIRARRALESGAGGFQAEVWLLDPGHVISFIEGEQAVTEVIAPRDLALPKRGLVREIDLAGEREERFEARGPLVYQMAYQVDAAGPETYRREAEELLAGARQAHLFAEDAGDAAERHPDAAGVAGRAFSYAVPELRANSLLVHTWHGFPAEATILKTQTLIEKGNP